MGTKPMRKSFRLTLEWNELPKRVRGLTPLFAIFGWLLLHSAKIVKVVIDWIKTANSIINNYGECFLRDHFEFNPS